MKRLMICGMLLVGFTISLCASEQSEWRRLLDNSCNADGMSNLYGEYVKIQDNSVKTKEELLVSACNNGNLAQVRALIQLGADPEAKDEWGMKALHVAAKAGHKGIVQFLLDQGVDVNAKDGYGLTPLHYVAFQGHEEIVKLLLSQPGIKVNAQNNPRRTPLHQAAYSDRSGINIIQSFQKCNIV